MRLLDMQISERAGSGGSDLSPTQLVHTVNLKLAALGCAPVESHSDEHFHEVARAIMSVPSMDSVTALFALEGLNQLGIGRGPQTDVMSVSFS